MREVELYRYLLGLEKPWTVTKVALSAAEQRVDVWLGHKRGCDWPCPECGTLYRLKDHTEERVWRHLDSCQYLTYLHARIPRVRCSDHGKRRVAVPWAEARSQFSAQFEGYAIDVLSEADVAGASRVLGISWFEAWHIMERAVERGLAAKTRLAPCRMGVDEKSIAKGQKYVTVVCDLDMGTVEYVGKDRKEASLDAYYESLPQDSLARIGAIAMDMWGPFYTSTIKHVPFAAGKIVFDRYHIMTYLGEAVDLVRRQENKELIEQGNNTLKGTRYYWLYNEDNLPDKYRTKFEAVRHLNLRTARAWAIKESFRAFWDYRTRAWALTFWRQWYFWATHCRLKPIIEAARTIQRHLANVLTYFEHHITNAMAEGLNSKIEKIKQSACGYRNPENFKTAIFFYCGGLDLYPVNGHDQRSADETEQTIFHATATQLYLW